MIGGISHDRILSRLVRLVPVALLALFFLPLKGQVFAQAAQAAGEPEALRIANDHFRNLEYDAARKQLEGWLQQHPSDLHALNDLATAVLYQEMFRRGLLELGVYGKKGEAFRPARTPVSPDFQQELFGILDKAENLAEERLKQNPKDEEALYWLGVSHGTRATFHFTLRRAYLSALHDAKEAQKRHRELAQLNPQFTDALFIIGVQDYVVGSLPWFIKVLAALAGAHGDRAGGLEKVKRVSEAGNYAREDAQNILAVLYQREERYADALAALQKLGQGYPRNYLLQQEIARLLGAQDDWRGAAKVYDAMVAKYHAGEPNFDKMPAARIFHYAGHSHERLQENQQALALYTEAGKLKDDDAYIYRCELAAADLEMRMDRPEQARLRYQRVAEAVPNSEEGKQARKALSKMSR